MGAMFLVVSVSFAVLSISTFVLIKLHKGHINSYKDLIESYKRINEINNDLLNGKDDAIRIQREVNEHLIKIGKLNDFIIGEYENKEFDTNVHNTDF